MMTQPSQSNSARPTTSSSASLTARANSESLHLHKRTGAEAPAKFGSQSWFNDAAVTGSGGGHVPTSLTVRGHNRGPARFSASPFSWLRSFFRSAATVAATLGRPTRPELKRGQSGPEDESPKSAGKRFQNRQPRSTDQCNHQQAREPSGLHSAIFHNDDLIIVQRAEEFHDSREPALQIGDAVQLNSGGPTMLVVDFQDATHVVCSWQAKTRAEEHVFPRDCVHRVSQV